MELPPTSTAEPPSFDDFYHNEHATQVRRALLLVGAEQAEDVVHEAFVKVYRRWGSIENPGGYLNRAVLNMCRDTGRRSSRRRRALERTGIASATDPDHYLTDALAALPFNQRAAIVLRYYAGMTTNEIASYLDASPGSVGPWVDRALKKLRKDLT